MYSGGWMVLSDSLRILRLEVSQPDGLILLNAKLPDNFSPAIGQQVIPETYNSLLAHTESSAESDSTDATPESVQPAVTDIVTQLWQLLQDDGLLDGLTALDISDTSQLSFTYQGRCLLYTSAACSSASPGSASTAMPSPPVHTRTAPPISSPTTPWTACPRIAP